MQCTQIDTNDLTARITTHSYPSAYITSKCTTITITAIAGPTTRYYSTNSGRSRYFTHRNILKL